MKIRGSIIWLIVIAAALIALVLWFGKKQPVETPLADTSTTNATVLPSTPATSQPTSASAHANTTVPKMTAPITTPLSQVERAIGILSTYNDVPIDFNGKVEDQFGNAVASATVSFSVNINNGHESTVRRDQSLTDKNGLFTITGYKGESLSIVPQKAGYVLATTSTFFKYSHMEEHPYVSDPNNPTVIKMWKLQGGEPLFSINQRYNFHYTDAPINFDLIAGEIVPTGGDIRIKVSRPLGDVSGRTRQDWSVFVEAVDGGLIEPSGDEVVYQAPADGYQQSDNFVMSTNAPYKWSGGFDQTFFLQSRHGQVYSKIDFGISINQHPDDYIWVEFHGVANTNSSRNWEATAPQ